MAGLCLNIALERHVLVMMLEGFHHSIHRLLSQWATILVVTIVRPANAIVPGELE
jgi:hypothetical protein